MTTPDPTEVEDLVADHISAADVARAHDTPDLDADEQAALWRIVRFHDRTAELLAAAYLLEPASGSNRPEACPRCGWVDHTHHTDAELDAFDCEHPWHTGPGDVYARHEIAAAIEIGRGVTNSTDALAARVLDALEAAGLQVVPVAEGTS